MGNVFNTYLHADASHAKIVPQPFQFDKQHDRISLYRVRDSL